MRRRSRAEINQTGHQRKSMDDNSNGNFYWYTKVPLKLIYDREISPLSIRIYIVIAGFSKSRKGCYLNNHAIAAYLGVHHVTVSKCISELKKHKYIHKYGERLPSNKYKRNIIENERSALNYPVSNQIVINNSIKIHSNIKIPISLP